MCFLGRGSPWPCVTALYAPLGAARRHQVPARPSAVVQRKRFQSLNCGSPGCSFLSQKEQGPGPGWEEEALLQNVSLMCWAVSLLASVMISSQVTQKGVLLFDDHRRRTLEDKATWKQNTTFSNSESVSVYPGAAICRSSPRLRKSSHRPSLYTVSHRLCRRTGTRLMSILSKRNKNEGSSCAREKRFGFQMP